MRDNNAITTEIIHKEIDLIQECIKRMSSNSFLLKGWLVSLIAVILAILPENIDLFIVIIILTVVTISFWYLDAFFLRTEKMYRKLYEWVISERLNDNNDMLYDLNPHRFSNQVDSQIKVALSPTLMNFYGILMLLVAILALCNLK